MYNLPKNYKLIAGGVAGLFLILILLLLPNNKKRIPSLISVSPAQNAISVDSYLAPSLTFSDQIETSKLSVTSTPEETWNLTFPNPYQAVLNHKLAFHPDTDYQIIISYSGKPLTTLKFRTQKSTGDPRLVQTLQEELDRDYPLAKKTPFETNDFKVVYIDVMTFQINLKNTSISQETAISQVKSWVSNNGGDAEKHKYVVIPFTK